MKFRGTVLLAGKTATAIVVPDEVVETLGTSRKPAVRVTIGDHTYRSTLAVRGGEFKLPLSAENREAAGVSFVLGIEEAKKPETRAPGRQGGRAPEVRARPALARKTAHSTRCEHGGPAAEDLRRPPAVKRRGLPSSAFRAGRQPGRQIRRGRRSGG